MTPRTEVNPYDYGTNKKIFTLGLVFPWLLVPIGYSIYLIATSDVGGPYKMISIFISTIIYANLAAGLSTYYLNKHN